MKELEIDDDSLFSIGLYSASDTARIVSQALQKRVGVVNLRRWAEGRKTFQRDYESIIGPRYLVASVKIFTFRQLIELLTIAFLRAEGFPLKKVRYAYERASELYGEYPFATRAYSVYGKAIFERRDSYAGVMEDLSSGRLGFEKILAPLLHHIVTYQDDKSIELNPLGKERSVILNPAIQYGSPVNKETGIPTSTLYGMWKSEHENTQLVAEWYGVEIAGVQDAVEYETALLKAA